MKILETSFDRQYFRSSDIWSYFLSFLCNRGLWVVLDGKCSQEYPVNAGVPQGSILGPILFLLEYNTTNYIYIYTFNDLPDDVACNIIAIYDADDTYSKCDWASNLWQELELAAEIESDLN